MTIDFLSIYLVDLTADYEFKWVNTFRIDSFICYDLTADSLVNNLQIRKKGCKKEKKLGSEKWFGLWC